jgi:hypothetical protein
MFYSFQLTNGIRFQLIYSFCPFAFLIYLCRYVQSYLNVYSVFSIMEIIIHIIFYSLSLDFKLTLPSSKRRKIHFLLSFNFLFCRYLLNCYIF